MVEGEVPEEYAEEGRPALQVPPPTPTSGGPLPEPLLRRVWPGEQQPPPGGQ